MATTTGITKFYTIDEVAKILRVCRRTVERYMACGMPYKKFRGSVRIPEDKLKAWMEEEGQVDVNE